MPKKPGRRHLEMLTRSAEISTFRASVSLHIDEPRRPDPEFETMPWLELRGTMNEPIRDVKDVVFSVLSEGQGRCRNRKAGVRSIHHPDSTLCFCGVAPSSRRFRPHAVDGAGGTGQACLRWRLLVFWAAVLAETHRA